MPFAGGVPQNSLTNGKVKAVEQSLRIVVVPPKDPPELNRRFKRCYNRYSIRGFVCHGVAKRSDFFGPSQKLSLRGAKEVIIRDSFARNNAPDEATGQEKVWVSSHELSKVLREPGDASVQVIRNKLEDLRFVGLFVNLFVELTESH